MRLRFLPSFEKEYTKIVRGSAILNKKIRKQLFLLQNDVNHPSLRLHKIGTKYWSVSVDKSVRIIIVIETQWIYVCHVGKHEDVY